MIKSRVNAIEAKSITARANQEIALKNSLAELHQKKLNIVLRGIVGAAINGENSFEYIDEDSVFIKFCCEKLHMSGFYIGLNDSVSSETIKNIEQKIFLIEEKIDEVGISAAKEINALGNKLHLFLNSDTKYVATYEWLIDIYEGFPLISDEWYTLDDIEPLEIIDDAESDGLFKADQNNFEWQEKLRNIIWDVKCIHENAIKEIKRLREKIFSIEANRNLKDDKFRQYQPNDSELGRVFSVKFFWDLEPTSNRRNLSGITPLSPALFSWMSSKNGQDFFDCIDEKIQDASEKGENTIIQDIYSETDGSYVVVDIDEITVPPPDLVAEIYCMMGFEVEVMSDAVSDHEWSDSSSIQLKITWR